VKNALDDSPAWSVLLPEDTIRLPGRGHGSRQFRRVMPSVPEGRTWAIIGAPWSCGRNEQSMSSDADVVHAYAIYPRHCPVVVASKDAAVLRYVATSVLSVPPGAGRILSVVFTSGMRLLRLPIMWTFAAVARASATVLVGRAG
jgi:hypothetical protein